jgi:hypothetical protein
VRDGGTLDPDPEDRDPLFSIGTPPVRTFAPEIAFVNACVSSQQAAGLEFPHILSPTGFEAILGPNFLIVPEPSTLGLGVLGFAAMMIGCTLRETRIAVGDSQSGQTHAQQRRTGSHRST